MKPSKLFHDARSHPTCMLDVLECMCRGNEPCFKLRWREIDAFVQHPVKKSLEPLSVALHCISEVVNRLIGEVGAEHGAAAVERHRHVGGFRRVPHSRFELCAELFEQSVGIGGTSSMSPWLRRVRI